MPQYCRFSKAIWISGNLYSAILQEQNQESEIIKSKHFKGGKRKLKIFSEESFKNHTAISSNQAPIVSILVKCEFTALSRGIS